MAEPVSVALMVIGGASALVSVISAALGFTRSHTSKKVKIKIGDHSFEIETQGRDVDKIESEIKEALSEKHKGTETT